MNRKNLNKREGVEIKYSRKLKFIKFIFKFVPRINFFYKISIWYVRHFFGYTYGVNNANDELNIIKKICKKKPLIFDIGGNLGVWSLCVIKKITDAKIHMFEPSPLIYTAAQTNLKNYNIKVNNLAVGDKVGKRKFLFMAILQFLLFIKMMTFTQIRLN